MSSGGKDTDNLQVDNVLTGQMIHLNRKQLRKPKFDATVWYLTCLRKLFDGSLSFWEDDWCLEDGESDDSIFLSASYADRIEQNTGSACNFTRKVPHPLVVEVKIEGHPCRALIDSGSLSDFISTKAVETLKLKTFQLAKPIDLHLAVQGSRSKINYGTKPLFEYQNVKEHQYFDVANLSNYDMILGTPFLYQHKVSFRLHNPHIVIGSTDALPIEGANVSWIDAWVVDVAESPLKHVQQHLLDDAEQCGLFVDAAKQPLLPLRAINHEVTLINPEKQYHWRSSRCSESLREQ